MTSITQPEFTQPELEIIIVGGGLAGLAAAVYCEKKGIPAILLEADNRLGGRIQTDDVAGFQLDRGFQVLLSSYEKANELIDIEALKVGNFMAGAVITDEKGTFRVMDPRRKGSRVIPMLFSRMGGFRDKLRLRKLTKRIKKMSWNEVFADDGMTAMEYLKDIGFTDSMLQSFFIPFYGGIFLENELSTPASMFRFTFKHFTSGVATLPAKGMGSIPQQLASRLKKTEIRLNAGVKRVLRGGIVEMQSGEELVASKIIVACDPRDILPDLAPGMTYRNTTTMYFSAEANLKKMGGTLGLDARSNSPINNYARLDEVVPHYAPVGKSLWSVTLRQHSQNPEDSVRTALAELVGSKPEDFRHLKTYHIDRALPVVQIPRRDIQASETKISDHLYLAGDHVVNASIDGALRSGQRAAEAATSADVKTAVLN